MSFSLTAFGNAPSMSRNNTEGYLFLVPCIFDLVNQVVYGIVGCMCRLPSEV
jgi:hypothetical protein